MGVKEEELQVLVNAWRTANPNITRFWWSLDKAALTAVRDRILQIVGRIKFTYTSGIIFIALSSGRVLSYIKSRIEINKFGREGITYEGICVSKQLVVRKAHDRFLKKKVGQTKF